MSTQKDRVRDIMTTNVQTIGRNATLDVVDTVMASNGIHHLPVVEEGRLVGMVSERDLLRKDLANALGYGETARRKLLRAIPVKEVMAEPVFTVPPEKSVAEAAQAMVEHKISCLPVVVGSELVGIVTATDLLNYSRRHEVVLPPAEGTAAGREDWRY